MISDSWSGAPDSVSVGTSGSAGERCAPVTAIARTLPCLTWPAAVEIDV